MIEKLFLSNFTVFESLEIDFSPGVNIFIGENGTGKTHVLKLLYSVLAACREKIHPGKKLASVFRPRGSIQQLVRRAPVLPLGATFRIETCDDVLEGEITKEAGKVSGFSSGFDPYIVADSVEEFSLRPVFIPAKELLADAPGFIPLYNYREISNSEIEFDFLNAAYLPELRKSSASAVTLKVIDILESALGGTVIREDQYFYLVVGPMKYEFSLVAEGHRKLAALLLMVRNGLLDEKSILFWDEPEANLNPQLLLPLIQSLLELERAGVQIFIATHSYPLLKEFDLQRKENALRYYALYKDEEGRVLCNPSDSYLYLHPNAITDHFDRIYDLELDRTLLSKV